MIFLRYSNAVRETWVLPELASTTKGLDRLSFKVKAIADEIFMFEDHKTVYIKNRLVQTPYGYQYTDEERLMIILKAVPL